MTGIESRSWLFEIRDEANFTQEQVALAAGIQRTTYASIEQGYRTPSVKTAKRIAHVLGFKWTIFFEDGLHVLKNRKKVNNE